MAPAIDDDWSDSNEELLPEVETSVLLGVPDGVIETPSDIQDVAVSRIGGLPALLSSTIPFESSHCKNCASAMELLVQMWSPFENSPYDRALYVWGCAKSGCQNKVGSVRAWRGLRYNEKYAEKLKRKQERKHAQDHGNPAQVDPAKAQPKTNPFAMSMGAATTPQFGLGSEIFGTAAPSSAPTRSAPVEESPEDDGSDTESTASSTSSVIVALASTTLVESPWLSAPSYAPQYLSTVAEYLPPPRKVKEPAPEDDVAEGRQGKGDLWAAEKYENSLETDQIFDRFNQRVAIEAQQCVRYELGGIPLPFATDNVFNRLFPQPQDESGVTIVTKADFKVQPMAPRRVYDSASLPACSHCGARRVFECQLMPNLINVLKHDSEQTSAGKKFGDEERRKEVQRALKGGAVEGRGMEWGTILVFSCERDCCLGPGRKGEAKEGWKEELVFVHWDT